jgi:hypothetical protein
LTAVLIVTFTTEFGAVIDSRRHRVGVLIGGAVANFALHIPELHHAQSIADIEKVVETAVGKSQIPAGRVAGQAGLIPL